MRNKDDVLHLIGEISNYLLESGPGRMVLSIRQEPGGTHLCAMDDTKRSPEEMAGMREALNTGMRPELAEYYGSMGGSDLLGAARLNLIGWQVKRSEVSQIDGGTKIDLWMDDEQFDSSCLRSCDDTEVQDSGADP